MDRVLTPCGGGRLEGAGEGQRRSGGGAREWMLEAARVFALRVSSAALRLQTSACKYHHDARVQFCICLGTDTRKPDADV